MEPWLLELLIFLPAILFLGLKTSYDDIKIGKIRNKYIILAIIYFFIAYSAIIFVYRESLRVEYLTEMISNAAISLIVAISLWHAKFWSAADGKLFFAYSILTPISIYKYMHINFFPSLVLLTNIFVPFLFFAIFNIIGSISITGLNKILKRIKLRILVNFILIFFWSSWLLNYLFSWVGIKLDFLFNILLLFGVVSLIYSLAGHFTVYVSLILSVLRLILDSSVYSVNYLWQFLIMSASLMALFLIFSLGMNIFAKEVKIKDLRKGMIIADIIYKEKKSNIYNTENPIFIEPQFLKEKDILKLEQYAEGLTDNDIKNILKLNKNKKLAFYTMRIQKTVPFAPFIFLGFILTLISQGNFLFLIKRIIVIFINKI